MCLKVVLPVMATAIALAPSAPILLVSRLKREGRVRSRLNNILIHLHNYTADIYRGGGYCIVVGGKSRFGGWGGIGEWINLLEVGQGGVSVEES